MSILNKIIYTLIIVVPTAFSIPATSKEKVVSNVIPIVRIYPQYPFKAALDKTEGWVKVQMTINEKGVVTHTEVLDSHPPQIFDLDATLAASKFKFKPKTVDGIPVQAIATQTIEFSLPENTAADDKKDQVIKHLYDKLIDVPIEKNLAIIEDSVEIQSDLSIVELSEIHFFYANSEMKLNPEPFIWNNKVKLDIDDKIIEQQLLSHSNLVADQHRKHPGIYRKYHSLYTAKSHPPTLISTIDLVQPKKQNQIRDYELRLNISSTGKVTKWKDLRAKEYDNKFETQFKKSRQAHIDTIVKQMIFKPAFKNYKAVAGKIDIKFQTMWVNQFNVLREATIENMHLVEEKPWVKVAGLVNEKGEVIESMVLDSSGSKFENIAIQSIENHQFPAAAKNHQFINLIQLEIEE